MEVCTKEWKIFFILINFYFENVLLVKRFIGSYSVFIYDWIISDIYCLYRLILYVYFFMIF